LYDYDFCDCWRNFHLFLYSYVVRPIGKTQKTPPKNFLIRQKSTFCTSRKPPVLLHLQRFYPPEQILDADSQKSRKKIFSGVCVNMIYFYVIAEPDGTKMNGVHFRNSNSVTEYHSAPEFGPIR
jgi:hypothetical protein